MIHFQSDDSPFMRVVREPLDVTYTWDGQITVHLPNQKITGRGSVTADASDVQIEIHDLPLEVAFQNGGLGPQNAPGVLREDYGKGTAEPADGTWNAASVIHTGTSIGESVVMRFTAAVLSLKGPPNDREVHFSRFVYQGGFLNYATTMTDFPHSNGLELRRDRLVTTFRGRRLEIRNLTDNGPAARCFIAIVIDGPKLTDVEQNALWLLLSYLNGARTKPIHVQYFDDTATSIEKVVRLGVPFGHDRKAPFDYRTAQPSSQGVASIVNGFYKMLQSSFPINMILHHLHDANTNNVETDAIHLLLAIHTAFEAWARANNREWLLGPHEWNSIDARINEALKGELLDLPAELTASIRNKLRSANQTSMGYRERYLFESLGIVLDAEDKATLRKRNELFHNGYLKVRFEELAGAQQQLRVDTPARLRNLVNLIILKMVGYDGYVQEFTRYGKLRVTPSEDSPFA